MSHSVLRVFALLMVLAAGVPIDVSAHPGDGIDVGQARMSARSQGGEAWVSVEVLSPRPCPGIEAQAVMATRADLSVSGGLQPDGECRFSGTLQVPEQGKWTVTFALLIDGQRSQVELPISVTDEEQAFLREDFLHVPALSQEPSTLERVQNALPGSTALIGVGLGGLALGAWLWRARQQERGQGRGPGQGSGPTPTA